MKGRRWLVLGVAAGIAVGIGKLPYFAGAAVSLSDTAEHLVGTGGLDLLHRAARHGAPQRVLEALMAIIAVVLPGVTAVLLLVAARSTLRLRSIISLLLAALGVASFFYLPHGIAAGTAALAFVAAGIAVVATGPLVAAPLAGVAGLIAVTFLPRLLARHSTVPSLPIERLHEALFQTAGAPLWLRIIVLIIAALPFVVAARLVIR